MATSIRPPAARRDLGLLISVLLLAAPLALLVLLLLPQLRRDEQPVTAMVAANALYASGQFDLAAQAYAQLQEQGYGGQALLTNHGLALLQAGRLDEAAAVLEQAQAQFPRDENIRNALAEVERLAAGQSPGTGEIAAPDTPSLAPAATPLARLRAEWLSADEAALLALLLWTATAALGVAAVRLPRQALRRVAAAGAVTAGLLTLAALLLMVA